MKQIEQKWLGVDDAEARTGISRWTWRRMAYSGRIGSSKVGKRLLISVAECDRIIAAGYRPAINQEREQLGE